MQLDYFSGDYTRSNTQISFTTSPQAAAAQYHSGMITGQHWRSEGTLVGTQNGAYTYSYDPRYQLAETQFGSVSGGVFTPNGTVYKESNLTYDWNGNIQSLKRYDATVAANQNTVVEPIHNFTYQYLQKNNLPTNQLASIPNYGSYQYDQLGQLSHEQLVGKPDRYYSYEVSGKVSGLYADANRTQPKVQFGYDAIGQRLYKYSSESQLTTYYVRDASGNVLAIYEKTGNTNPIQQEIPIYGSGRLGTLNVLARSYVYELRDHLGNVRVVVGKVNGSLDIFSQSDYYALGSVLRRRGDYRYGYQGMYAEEDKETGKNSFELRMYDAVIGRWLSIDPAREFPSPYVAMGNNWVSVTDPDGGCTKCPQNAKAGDVFNHPDYGNVTFNGSSWGNASSGTILDDIVVQGQRSVGPDLDASIAQSIAAAQAKYRASSRFFLGYPDWVTQQGAAQGFDAFWKLNWGRNGLPSHPSARGNVEFDNTLAMLAMPVPKFLRVGGEAAVGVNVAEKDLIFSAAEKAALKAATGYSRVRIINGTAIIDQFGMYTGVSHTEVNLIKQALRNHGATSIKIYTNAVNDKMKSLLVPRMNSGKGIFGLTIESRIGPGYILKGGL